MKKIFSLFIALLMVFSLNVSSVMAESVDSAHPDKAVTEMIVVTAAVVLSYETSTGNECILLCG